MFKLLLSLASRLVFLALHVKNGSFPPALSAAKEAELVALAEKGSQEARNSLIEHNLRLVAHIVKKYYATGADQDDLISIGTIGLIKGVSTFRSDKGIRLATYAARCIENEILMFFRNRKKSAQDIMISEPIDTDRDGNALTLIDIIADNRDIEDEIEAKMKVEQLKKVLPDCLDEREMSIIKMRYGLNGNAELTQNEIAKKLQISRSYVSRIEKSALLKLRKRLEE